MNNNTVTTTTTTVMMNNQQQQSKRQQQPIFPTNAIQIHTNAISTMLDNLAAIPSRQTMIQQLPQLSSLNNDDFKFDQAEQFPQRNVAQVLEEVDAEEEQQQYQQSKSGGVRPLIPKPKVQSSSSSSNSKLTPSSDFVPNTSSSRRKQYSQSSRQTSTIGELSRNYDQIPLGISQSLFNSSQKSGSSNRGAITSGRDLNQNKKHKKSKSSFSQNNSKSPIASSKSSWLLQAENYVLNEKDDSSLENVHDFLIRTNQSLQSLVSSESGQQNQDHQSVCIVTIPKKKLEFLNNKYLGNALDVNKKSPRQHQNQKEQAMKKVPTLNLDLSTCLNKNQADKKKPKQNYKLIQHIETLQFSPLNSSNASTPSRRMNQTQTLELSNNSKQQSAFKAAKDDLKQKNSQKKKKPKVNTIPLNRATSQKQKLQSGSQSPDKKSRNCTARSSTSRLTSQNNKSNSRKPNPTQLLTGLNPPNSQFDLTPLLKHRKKSPSTIIFQSNYTTTSSSLAPRSLSSMSQSAAVPLAASSNTSSTNIYHSKRKPTNQSMIKSPNNNKRVLSSSFGTHPTTSNTTTRNNSTSTSCNTINSKNIKSQRKGNEDYIEKRKNLINRSQNKQNNNNNKSPQFQMKKVQLKQKTSPTSSQSSCSLYHQANNKKYHLQDQIKQATEKEEDSNTYRFSRNYYSGKKSSRNEQSRNNNCTKLSTQSTNKAVKPNFKIKSYQPLSPRSSSSSYVITTTAANKNNNNKIPMLKLNSPSNIIVIGDNSNKGSIPDDEQAFFIKSSRECQAKQPYTATYNQSNRPDSVSNKNSSSCIGMQKFSCNSQFDLGVKSQSQIYSPKSTTSMRGKSMNEFRNTKKSQATNNKKKTVSFQFNQDEQGAGIPVTSHIITNSKERQRINSENTYSKYKLSKQQPQNSALSAMHKYYQKQLDDKDKQIEKHKNFIMQLKGSIQSLLVQHSKCKNDLQRTKTQLTELKKIHQDSFKRPGQSLRESKDKQDLDYFEIFDKKHNLSGQAKSLDIQINQKSFGKMMTNKNSCSNDESELQSSRSRSSSGMNKITTKINKSFGYNKNNINKSRPNSAFSVNHIHKYSNRLSEINKYSRQKQQQQRSFSKNYEYDQGQQKQVKKGNLQNY